jgi:3,4-dihydroxy 2-butanone 4-phosphate synthase/GTP cyclohydrolase II
MGKLLDPNPYDVVTLTFKLLFNVIMHTSSCNLFRLKMITIADLIKYRFKRETLVRSIGVPSSFLPIKGVSSCVKVKSVSTPYGPFQVHIFESVLNKSQHMVFVRGNPATPGIAVRVQLECIARDVFMVDSTSHGSTIREAMETVNNLGNGIIVYLRGVEGNGMGLMSANIDDITSEAKKENNYVPNVGIGAQILASLGVTSIKVLSNNEKRYPGLEGYGIEVIGRIPIVKSSAIIPQLPHTTNDIGM